MTAREPDPRFFESLPLPFGEGAAVDALATIAAPLLAGFSFALIGLIITSPSSLHWPSLTLALLVAAGLVLSLAVQFGSIARRWAIPPADWRELLQIAPEDQLVALSRAGPGALDKQRRWLLWTRATFNVGLVLLFVAVAFALVPANPGVALTGGRIVAIVFAGIGAVGQAGVTVAMGTRALLWNREIERISRARRAQLEDEI